MICYYYHRRCPTGRPLAYQKGTKKTRKTKKHKRKTKPESFQKEG